MQIEDSAKKYLTNVKPRSRHIIAFEVIDREKDPLTGLHKGWSCSGNYVGVHEIWPLRISEDCRQELHIGTKYYIGDGLAPHKIKDLSIVAEDYPITFMDLLNTQALTGGRISTICIFEDYLLAVDCRNEGKKG